MVESSEDHKVDLGDDELNNCWKINYNLCYIIIYYKPILH